MPKRDGFKVMEEIKKNPVWSKIPVIVASNLGQKEDIDWVMVLGAKDFFSKIPFSRSSVVHTKVDLPDKNESVLIAANKGPAACL